MSNRMHNPITRRTFLRTATMAAGGALLAACGAPAPTQEPAAGIASPAAAATNTSMPAVTAAPAQEVTLRYIHWWCEGDAHASTLQWQIDEFQSRNPGIKIDSVCIPSDAPSKISTECAAGQCPEIINWASATQAEEGLLLDLSEWMNENKDRFIWTPDVIQLKVGDKLYGWSAEFGTVPLVWNTRLLEKAGVSDVPTTWDEVLVAAERLKAIEVAWSNTCWTPGYFCDFLPQIPGAHEAWIKAGETGNWDVPELREAAAEICKKILEVLPFTLGSDAEDDWDAAVKNFITEQTASELNGAWTIGNDLKAEGAAEGLMDVCTAKPWPKAFDNGPSIEIGTYTMIGLSAQVANDPAVQEAAFKFLEWWISEEVAKRYISEAQSPLGVTEPVSPDLAGRLLSEFYTSVDEAKSYFTTPATMTKVGDGWNAPIDAIRALHAGMSVEEAAEIWLQEMTPAT